MASFVIKILADNLIEIVHALYRGRGARKRKNGYVSSNACVWLVDVWSASKLGRTGKVTSIVQSSDVGVDRTWYNDIGVGVTREEKAQPHNHPVGPPRVIAGDQAQIIDRMYRRRTGSFIRMDYYEVGAVWGRTNPWAAPSGISRMYPAISPALFIFSA